MVHQFPSNFPHEFNEDGSFDSICADCHSTVARADTEADLALHERSHRCDPLLLEKHNDHPLWPIASSGDRPRPRGAAVRMP